MSQDFIEDVGWKFAKKILAKLKQIFWKKQKQEAKKETLSIANDKEKESRNENEVNENVVKDNEDNHNIENCIERDLKNDVDKDELANIEADVAEKSCENNKIEDVGFSDALKDDDSENHDESEKLIATEDSKEGSSSEVENISESDNIQSNGNQESIKSWFEILENDEIFFHFTIFLLWSIVTFINIPVVLTWAHNYK